MEETKLENTAAININENYSTICYRNLYAFCKELCLVFDVKAETKTYSIHIRSKLL